MMLRWPQVLLVLEPLAYYAVKVNRRGELTTVTQPRLLPTRGRHRRRRADEGIQGQLTESAATG